jgi:glycosyltransferase involved in cell wall biosynthesis
MQNNKVCVLTTVHAMYDNRIYHKQVKSLVKGGYTISLIAQSEYDEPVLNQDGVKIIPLPKAKNRLHRIFCLTLLALIKAISVKAKVYHFHDPELIPAGLLLKLFRRHVIYDIHEDYFTSILQKNYLPKPLRVLIAGVYGLFELMTTKAFQLILAEKYYSKKYPTGIKVLNYPQKSLFSFSSGHIKGDKPRLLYTGVVDEDRGALIHASILNYIDDIELYIIGRCRHQLAEKIYNIVEKKKERLIIIGAGRHVSFKEIMDYYLMKQWTAGLAIFPPTEHYMNKELTKIFEYMAAGIPVICSKFPVWSSIIEGENVGLTVNPQDMKEISTAIHYLHANEEVRLQMGQKGRLAVETKYNWENEELKLLKLYRGLMS